MWPSQRAQSNLINLGSGTASKFAHSVYDVIDSDLPYTSYSHSQRHDSATSYRASLGKTSKIEIRHTKNKQPLSFPSKILDMTPLNQSPSTFVSTQIINNQGRSQENENENDVSRRNSEKGKSHRVNFTKTLTTLKSPKSNMTTTNLKGEIGQETYRNNDFDSDPEAHSQITFISTKSAVLTADGPIKANELVGKVAIGALCNRDSVIDNVGGPGCSSHAREQLGTAEIEELKSMSDEDQKDALCNIMIKLVEDQEVKNQAMAQIKAQQNFPTTKIVKVPKNRHILCVGGRTMDGSTVPIGHFPNSFADMKHLMNLRRDPLGFKRFTAKSDMSGFRDEEITLTNEGNILKIIGHRLKTATQSAKIVTEEIQLPKGVYADTLKVGRNSKGFLIIQEPWRF